MDEGLRTLPDALAVLRRRWLTWVSFLILGAAAGVGLSLLQTPQYTATASVSLNPVSVTAETRALDPGEVATQADTIVSDPVANRVIKALSLTDMEPIDLREKVTAEPRPDSQGIDVGVTWPTATGAADVANAFVREFRQLGAERTQAAQDTIIKTYTDQITQAKTELSKLQAQVDAAGDLGVSPDVQGQVDSLTARIAELEAARVTAADPAAVIPQARIENKATVPAGPSSPDPIRSGILGAVLGLVLGLLAAFARERFDDKLRDSSEAQTLLHSPVLGHIPRFEGPVAGRVASLVNSHSTVAEAFRVLNTNIRFLLATHRRSRPATGAPTVPTAVGTVMVASGSPGEGKTSVAANLAVTAARGGSRVILVEADLRSPAIGALFGIESPRGLADLLIDGGSVADYLLDVGIENLYLLPAGSIPPNPAELLASPQAQQMWTELTALADLVVIDTPPLLRVADAMEVAAAADVVVLTARHGVTRTHQLQAAAQRLHQVGASVSGIVINAEPPGNRNGYAYGYGQRESVRA